MHMIRRLFPFAAIAVSLALAGQPGGVESRGPVLEAMVAQGAQPPVQQDEFVPIDQLPPQDQLPAAPLLIAAYGFVMLALFAYLVSVARRLGSVQKELQRLESDLKRGHRS